MLIKHEDVDFYHFIYVTEGCDFRSNLVIRFV